MNQVYLEWKIIVISRFKIIQMKNTLYIGFDLYGNAGLWDKILPYSLEFAQIKAPPPHPQCLWRSEPYVSTNLNKLQWEFFLNHINNLEWKCNCLSMKYHCFVPMKVQCNYSKKKSLLFTRYVKQAHVSS